MDLPQLDECREMKERLDELIEKIPSVQKAKKTRRLASGKSNKPSETEVRGVLAEIEGTRVTHPKVDQTKKHLETISAWKQKVEMLEKEGSSDHFD